MEKHSSPHYYSIYERMNNLAEEARFIRQDLRNDTRLRIARTIFFHMPPNQDDADYRRGRAERIEDIFHETRTLAKELETLWDLDTSDDRISKAACEETITRLYEIGQSVYR